MGKDEDTHPVMGNNSSTDSDHSAPSPFCPVLDINTCNLPSTESRGPEAAGDSGKAEAESYSNVRVNAKIMQLVVETGACFTV